MFTDLIRENLQNREGECANLRCGFANRRQPARARYYDTQRKSWVCASCAQGINRQLVQAYRKITTDPTLPQHRARCISGEEATLLRLQGKM